MGKFLVRITIVLVTIHFLLSFYVAQFIGIDILNDYHSLAFELCVVVYSFSEGKYHCRYLKFLALGIFLTDSLSRLDNSYNFLSVSEHNLYCFVILSVSIGIALYKAIKHFHDVSKIKRKRAKLYGRDIDNKLRRIEYDKENGV